MIELYHDCSHAVIVTKMDHFLFFNLTQTSCKTKSAKLEIECRAVTAPICCNRSGCERSIANDLITKIGCDSAFFYADRFCHIV